MTLFQMAGIFSSKFHDGGDIRAYFAPGRVNLIGEHIDYNGGHVFPCALSFGNYAIARKRSDRKLRFYSHNYRIGGIMESSLDDLVYKKKDGWINYPKGVIKSILDKGYKVDCGLDVLVWGNIPGSGLSSSAAMEVVIATAVNDLFALNISPIELALLSQQAENHFCGMNCGIMDQFASAMGKKDNAIYLDCHDLTYRYIPFRLPGVKLVLTNSNKPHSLISSHYNDRRKECEMALKDLQKVVKIQNLCQLNPLEFEKYKNVIQNEKCRLRAKHAVYEEQRTKEAIDALNRNDIEKLGQLLNESGDSLRCDYDATCMEIDTLVDSSRRQKGVYGVRETGGGWGGNIIALVQEEFVGDYKRNVTRDYKIKTKLSPSFAEVSIGDGARRLF
jgi:galactokinase